MRPTQINADGTSTNELRRSVPYSSLLKQAQDIVTLVSPLCTLSQNALSNHLSELADFFRQGDYSNTRHAESSIASFTNVIVGLGVNDKSADAPNMPKQRVGKRRGRNPVHRLGSVRSTVSSKTLRKCGFCKSQGDGTNDHKNQSNCPVKASLSVRDKYYLSLFMSNCCGFLGSACKYLTSNCEI